MKLDFISFFETRRFSKLFNDYVLNSNDFLPNGAAFTNLEDFQKQIEIKSDFPVSNRLLLAEILNNQYINCETSELVRANIDLLKKPNTFTISCGHQLNIFGGPLYILYKIATVIAVCSKLKSIFPDYNFIPIHWMATEDHDVEEIRKIQIFGKEYTWETIQSGPTGLLSTKYLPEIADQIKDLPEIFKEAYSKFDNLSYATRYYLNHYFQEYGLVIVDANEKEFKKLFIPIFLDELKNQKSYELISEKTEILQINGYESQVNAREINLFYLNKNERQRIVFENDRFTVLNTKLSFTFSEIKSLVEEFPEKFSPNVVLRPLYSQILLPDIAFIGGPAEISYWLQLTAVFSCYKVSFPILIPRFFALLINENVQKKLEKLGIDKKQLFQNAEELIELLIKKAGYKTDLKLDSWESFESGFYRIAEMVKQIDASLEPTVQVEKVKLEKALDLLEKKLEKAAEKRIENDISQLKNVLEKLFPGENLQERTESWIQFIIAKPGFIEDLVKNLKLETNQFAIVSL